MTEDLDDLRAFHHLLNEALFLSERPLLSHHEAGGIAGEFLRDPRHHEQNHKNGERKPDAVIKHHDEDRRDREHRLDHHRDRLADHLPDRIGVVGIRAHDVAVSMRVKITDRKALHPVEHISPEIVQRSLRHRRHQSGVDQ